MNKSNTNVTQSHNPSLNQGTSSYSMEEQALIAANYQMAASAGYFPPTSLGMYHPQMSMMGGMQPMAYPPVSPSAPHPSAESLHPAQQMHMSHLASMQMSMPGHHMHIHPTMNPMGSAIMNGISASPSEPLSAIERVESLKQWLTSDGKHRLANGYTFWVRLSEEQRREQDQATTYDFVKAITFTTVEDFWLAYSYLRKPDTGSTYCLFRQDSAPMWEHPSNAQGGRWIAKLKKVEHPLRSWETTVLSIVGDTYGLDKIICGVTFHIRRKVDAIHFWNANASDKKEVELVQEVIRRILGPLKTLISLEYVPHAVSKENHDRLVAQTSMGISAIE